MSNLLQIKRFDEILNENYEVKLTLKYFFEYRPHKICTFGLFVGDLELCYVVY